MNDMNIPIDEEFPDEAKSGQWTEQFSVSGGKLVETIQDLMHEAVVRKISVVDKNGKTLIDIPLYAGVFGVVLMGYWSVLALIAAWFSEVSVRIVREEMPEAAEKSAPVVSGQSINEAAERAGQTFSEAAERAGTSLSDFLARASKSASEMASRAADSLEPKTNGNGEATKSETKAKSSAKTATKASSTAKATTATASAATASADPARCQALTKSGTQCKNNAIEGSKFCRTHQPA